MGFKEPQADEAQLRAFRLDAEAIRAIRPIPIIRSEGWGPLPAVEISDRLGIANQLDREKLDGAKAEIDPTGSSPGLRGGAGGGVRGRGGGGGEGAHPRAAGREGPGGEPVGAGGGSR